MPAALDHHTSDMFGYSGGNYPAGQLLQPRPGDSNVRGIPIDVVEFDGEVVPHTITVADEHTGTCARWPLRCKRKSSSKLQKEEEKFWKTKKRKLLRPSWAQEKQGITRRSRQ